MSGKKGKTKQSIDWSLVVELCRIHCTKEEILGVLNAQENRNRITERTFDRAIRAEKKLTFDVFFKMHSSNGNASLRRQQWAAAMGEKRKKTILVREKITYPDGTVVETLTPKDIEYYPPPSERMQIWIGQHILGQGATEKSAPDQAQIPIGTVRIEIIGDNESQNFTYDQKGFSSTSTIQN